MADGAGASNRVRAFYFAGAAVLAAMSATACGSGPTAPSGNATITISAAGIAPSEVRIRRWNHVTFVNTDARPHSMVSDPVDVHSECPPVNRVGFLQPGESRDTGALDLTGSCGFHDHLNQTDAGLRGRIIVE